MYIQNFHMTAVAPSASQPTSRCVSKFTSLVTTVTIYNSYRTISSQITLNNW